MQHPSHFSPQLAFIHVLGFLAFLVIEFSPVMNKVLNPLEFLQELDRQRQLDAVGESHVADEQERVGLLEAASADPLYDDGTLPMDGERDFSIQRMSGEIVRAREESQSPELVTGTNQTRAARRAQLWIHPSCCAADGSSILFEGKPRSRNWRLLRAGVSPVLNQLAKAFMVYFVNPGLLTFLTNDALLISYMIVTAQVCNMLGRLATGFYTSRQVTLLNLFCTLFFAYESAIALWSYPAPLPDVILVPVTGIYAFVNGYVSTVVYLVADTNAERYFSEDEALPAARLIRRWITLVNQIGSVGGSLLCAWAANTGYLKAKLPQCTPGELTTSAATTNMAATLPPAGFLLAMAMNPPF